MSASSSVSDFVTVRGVKLHVRRWGRPDAPTLFMLHGWMDVAASFQFVVDALAGDWQVIAPDARGFGLSDWPVARQGGGHYWFHEYLGDLDALVDHYAPTGEVNLVGHSMGANVVCLYAGARPERVRRVVDLEGFGLAPARAEQAPRRLRGWLDELREPPV
ncbi:alpha/beta fold hydrolase, partial [Burkholderia diffusa]